MPISINLLKPIQTNSQQQLLPRNSQDTSSFVFKCACWSSRFFYLQSKQSILTFVCVLGYRPLSGFTGSAKYKVSNLICWNCQKDWSIHKFVLTLHRKHLDNNTIATKMVSQTIWMLVWNCLFRYFYKLWCWMFFKFWLFLNIMSLTQHLKKFTPSVAQNHTSKCVIFLNTIWNVKNMPNHFPYFYYVCFTLLLILM